MDQNNFIGQSAINAVRALSLRQVNLTDLLAQLQQHRQSINLDINAFDSCVLQPKSGLNSPLYGLPITVKDQIAVAGLPRNFGLDIAVRKPCTQTASVIKKFIDADATVIGKTSMPPLLALCVFLQRTVGFFHYCQVKTQLRMTG